MFAAGTFETVFLVAGFVRVQAELPVHLLPREPQRSAEGEGPVGEPEVEIEAQGAAF